EKSWSHSSPRTPSSKRRRRRPGLPLQPLEPRPHLPPCTSPAEANPQVSSPSPLSVLEYDAQPQPESPGLSAQPLPAPGRSSSQGIQGKTPSICPPSSSVRPTLYYPRLPRRKNYADGTSQHPQGKLH